MTGCDLLVWSILLIERAKGYSEHSAEALARYDRKGGK
jgi:hypothetical protein